MNGHTRWIPGLWLLAASVLLAVAFRSGRSDQSQQIVRAKKFIVVDDEGKAVGELGIEKGAVRLRIPAKIGQPGVAVGSYPENNWTGISLFDSRGHTLASLMQVEGKPPGLLFFDHKHRPRLTCSLGENQAAAFNVYDEKGKSRLYFGLDEAGRPSFMVLGPEEQEAGVLYSGPSGNGGLVVRDDRGRVIKYIGKGP